MRLIYLITLLILILIPAASAIGFDEDSDVARQQKIVLGTVFTLAIVFSAFMIYRKKRIDKKKTTEFKEEKRLKSLELASSLIKQEKSKENKEFYRCLILTHDCLKQGLSTEFLESVLVKNGFSQSNITEVFNKIDLVSTSEINKKLIKNEKIIVPSAIAMVVALIGYGLYGFYDANKNAPDFKEGVVFVAGYGVINYLVKIKIMTTYLRGRGTFRTHENKPRPSLRAAFDEGGSGQILFERYGISIDERQSLYQMGVIVDFALAVIWGYIVFFWIF